MKMRLVFIPPADRKPGISYLMMYVADAKSIMQAVTVELQSSDDYEDGIPSWQRVDLVTLPVANP